MRLDPRRPKATSWSGSTLFGIAHADELDRVSLRDLVKAAGIPTPYATEIRKGMRLADYGDSSSERLFRRRGWLDVTQRVAFPSKSRLRSE